MSKSSDLTGQTFGTLLVQRRADPYVSPSGKVASCWVCLCTACGREVTVPRPSLLKAKSCGCQRPKLHQKTCVICGKPFGAVPSSKLVTCSAACAEIRRKEIQLAASKGSWSLDAKLRRREAARTDPVTKARLQKASDIGLGKIHTMPSCQRGPQNRGCKIWVLIDPDGVHHYARGLLPWAREHYDLFETCRTPEEIEKAAHRIFSGFSGIARSMRGAGSHPSLTYKGWRLAQPPDKPDQT